jgi:hypothetical protein
MCTRLYNLTQSHDQHYEYYLNQVFNAVVLTYIHPLFDGTQTSLGPLKLGATYLDKALEWVARCFAIATIEVPFTFFVSILVSSIEIGLELLPRGHECAMCSLSRHESFPFGARVAVTTQANLVKTSLSGKIGRCTTLGTAVPR